MDRGTNGGDAVPSRLGTSVPYENCRQRPRSAESKMKRKDGKERRRIRGEVRKKLSSSVGGDDVDSEEV
jgi:hypothetical protein